MRRKLMALGLATAVGCGGHSSTTGPSEGGGPSGSGGSSGSAAAGAAAVAGAVASGGGAGRNDGPPPLLPQSDAPPVEGDGRLPDLPETAVGLQGTGWDLCSVGFTRSKEDCGACPVARGEQFLVVGSTVAEPAQSAEPAKPPGPQAYFYFHPATTASALWLDVAWLSGARSAELSLWETDTICQTQGSPEVFDISPLLVGDSGAWATACVPLSDFGSFAGLGFRIATAGKVGLDALRFGPPCPP